MFSWAFFLVLGKTRNCLVQHCICSKQLVERDEQVVNSLPKDKILDVTKLKAFADDKLNIAKMTISLLDRIENTVGKGENAGCQHFLLFPTVFSIVFLFQGC